MQLIANYTSTHIDPRDFAVAAEAEGFDGVGFADHLFRTGTYPHVWVGASAMAQATDRILITTGFANNLFRSPVEFAQAALTMQWLSDGRFEAGLGAGWLEAEVRAMGLEYPSPPIRARRYREAMLIVRELLSTGSCTFDGEHYRVDVPRIGPPVDRPPPLVASVGGPWTIRNISPLADRVEIKIGASTRGGDLDMGALALVGRDDVRRMIDSVREVAPDVPLSMLTMIAIGDETDVAPLRESYGDGLYADFVGEASEVLDNLRALGELGLDRVQINERVKGSLDRLAAAM